MATAVNAEERWVDVDEVAAHLGVSRDSVYRWIETKSFPAHRAGRLRRFKLSEVDAWVVRSGGPGDGPNATAARPASAPTRARGPRRKAR